MSQVRSTFLLFATQIVLKGSGFIKQLLLAYFLGVSRDLDLLIVAQIIPSIIGSIFSGGGGEIMAIHLRGDSRKNEHILSLLTFILLAITLFFNGIYMAMIPFFTDILDVEDEKANLFFILSLLISFSKLPLSIVSSLQQFIYVRRKYKGAMYVSIISEIIGVLFIVLTASKFGIISFAIALLLSASYNALGYLFLIKVNLFLSFNKRLWRAYKVAVANTLGKIINLGTQTLINHLSTFAERSLGFKYLSDGYVGAMNYAKSVTELPRVVMLSSILTTTYAEQIRLKNCDLIQYKSYSNRMNDIIFSFSIIAQIFSLIFAPYIILIFFQRGALNSQDLQLIQVIFQILSLSFIPGLMFGFLSKVMFIEGENSWMLKMTIVKTSIELILMYTLIFQIQQGIPIALSLSKIFFTIAILVYLNLKHPGLVNHKRFFWMYGVILLVSIFIFIINEKILNDFVITKSPVVHLFYLFSMLIFVFCAMLFLIRIHPEIRFFIANRKFMKIGKN